MRQVTLKTTEIDEVTIGIHDGVFSIGVAYKIKDSSGSTIIHERDDLVVEKRGDKTKMTNILKFVTQMVEVKKGITQVT